MSEAAVPSSEINKELAGLEPITKGIADAKLRDDVIRLLTAEILARLSLHQLVLDAFEDPDYSAPDIDMWDSVAQPVRSALIALLELRKLMGEVMPDTHEEPQGEVDVAFDVVDEPQEAKHEKDNVSAQVDLWVQSTLEGDRDAANKTPQALWAEVQKSVQPLAGILVSETQRFATRIRNPNVVVNRWILLGELQEFKGKFLKLLGAFRLGLLHPFTSLSESELLGDYRTEEQGSLLLRQAFIHLERDVLALIAVHAEGNPEEKRFAVEELLVRLMRFSKNAAFAIVRAPDKRALVEFRKTLASEMGKKGTTERRMTEIFEDLSKFLDMMHALNRREVILNHDKAALAELRSRVLTVDEVLALDVESAKKLLVEARADSQQLLGRDAMLDVWLESSFGCDSREEIAAVTKWVAIALQRVRL